MKYLKIPVGIDTGEDLARIDDLPHPQNHLVYGFYVKLMQLVAAEVHHETTTVAYSLRRWAGLLVSSVETVHENFDLLASLDLITVDPEDERFRVCVLKLQYYGDEWAQRKARGANEKRKERRAGQRADAAPHGSGASPSGSTAKKESEASSSSKKKKEKQAGRARSAADGAVGAAAARRAKMAGHYPRLPMERLPEHWFGGEREEEDIDLDCSIAAQAWDVCLRRFGSDANDVFEAFLFAATGGRASELTPETRNLLSRHALFHGEVFAGGPGEVCCRPCKGLLRGCVCGPSPAPQRDDHDPVPGGLR
jgi:hypothetical protein